MNVAQPCLAPDAEPRLPTRFLIPPGAVDSHAHVIGLPPDYPFVANRSFTPPEASPAAYLRLLDRLGFARGVLVQMSVHGTDNRLLVKALQEHPDRLRGIAAVPAGLRTPDLLALKDAGVVGLRINLVYGGGVGLDRAAEYAAMCEDLDWHLHVLMDVRKLPEVAPMLSRVRAPIVIDHMGSFPARGGVAEPGFRTLLSLVRDGAWVKLSGAYRLAEAPYTEVAPIARALLEAAPSRCLWGSDWPHVALWERPANTGDLLDLLGDWAPEEATRRAVLVDNPCRLYGFSPLP